jgi:hypothetical protein
MTQGKVFRKAVLSVDTYQSGDGNVTVTPQRLKHWEECFKGITQRSGLAVPMHFNHADLDDEELLLPITMDALSNRNTRGAHFTEGHVTDFCVAPDGNSAEITVEILTPSAREKVESNAVFVSPVIYPAFDDGKGNTYTDFISSIDLVDYPVDHSQGPFIPAEPVPMRCAIRMGIKPTYYHGIQRMSMQQPQQQPMQQQPADPQAGGGGDIVSQIASALNNAGIPLPDDTDASNIVDRLNQVLGGPGGNTTAVSPDIQTMSLSVKQHRQFAEGSYHRELTSELTQLRDTGRITDSEYSAYTAKIATQRLSLDQFNKPKKQSVETFIESRQVLPEGVFKTATYATPTSVVARMSAVPQPAAKAIPGSTSQPLDKERVKQLVTLVNGPR